MNSSSAVQKIEVDLGRFALTAHGHQFDFLFTNLADGFHLVEPGGDIGHAHDVVHHEGFVFVQGDARREAFVL